MYLDREAWKTEARRNRYEKEPVTIRPLGSVSCEQLIIILFYIVILTKTVFLRLV